MKPKVPGAADSTFSSAWLGVPPPVPNREMAPAPASAPTVIVVFAVRLFVVGPMPIPPVFVRVPATVNDDPPSDV